MTKSKFKNKYFLIFILLAVLLGSMVLAGAHFVGERIRYANAQVNVEISEDISEEYAFGDEFAVPECTFTRQGVSAKGVATLQYPDGTDTNAKNVSLNQSGKYVLRYIAKIGENVYTKEYGFTVYGKLASYSNSKTTMSYGLCTDLGANSTGLMVQIVNGDSLTFDHIFNMNELTMATKLLEGFVVPSAQGSADFSKMVFTFTDAEDPSVQLVYHGNFHNDSNAYGLTFFTAAGNGQVHCGLEYVGKLHVGSTLGCLVPHSFIAMDTGLYYGAQKPTPAAPDAKTFCISYDGKTNQAWAGGKIISDLDDSNYYDSLWFGFPSGKAKLTISALNYNNATANICFTSILGVDLSAENYIDDEAPVITIDSEYATMPSAVVGKHYPIPAASAMDAVNGVCDVKVSVWHDYGSANQKMVDIKDNRFMVNGVGAYAIVYEATDYSGNVNLQILWTRAYLSQYIRKLSVSIAEDYPTEVVVGTLQKLPEVTVTGGSGESEVTYTLTKDKKSCEIVDGTFCIEEAGEWTLTCTAVDYVGNAAVAIYKIKGVVSDKPIILEEPNFPVAYVSGATYTLPVLHAYDYRSGAKVEKLCSVTVEDNGQSKTYQAGATFTPSVENGMIKIVYSCDGVKLIEKEIPVIAVFGKEQIPGEERYRDVVYVEKYFYTDSDLRIENNTDLDALNGLMVTANHDADSVKATFINPQIANVFSLDLLTVPNCSKFTKMIVTLTDSENPEIVVKAILEKDDGQTKMTVGDTVMQVALDFDGASATSYNVGYSSGSFIINTSTLISINKTENGEAFNGFPSGKLVFDIELCDVEEGAAIFLHKICGNNVNNKQDNKGPSITTVSGEKAATNAYKDSVYTIEGVIVGDFLCPNVKTTLTVLAPDGSLVSTVDGVTLQGVDATKDYQIKLSMYGDYYIVINATEGDFWKHSNRSTQEYLITVVDGEKPKITMKGAFKTDLKAGDILVIPEYEIFDNYTAKENLSVMTVITNPKGVPVYLYGEENAIRCKYAGEYKIQIFVLDEMGNLAIYETSVTVK